MQGKAQLPSIKVSSKRKRKEAQAQWNALSKMMDDADVILNSSWSILSCESAFPGSQLWNANASA